ncbi:MAG: ESX secretion-associated protein EspG [Umezawaea sp.]
MTQLHPYEVDLLCTYAEVEPPFPLEVPSSGTTDLERSVVFQAALQTLQARGLATEGGPIGDAEEFVRMLRDRSGALDVVVVGEKSTVRAVAMVDGRTALLAVQRSDEEDEVVRLRSLGLDPAVDAPVRLIPAVEQAGSSPVNVPLRALRAAEAEMARRIEDGGEFREAELPDLLEHNGVDDRVLRRMLAHLQPVLGQGQLGASRPNGLAGDDREDVRFGAELSWLDTPRGRYKVSQEGEWVSANPLPREDVRDAVRRLLAPLRRDG